MPARSWPLPVLAAAALLALTPPSSAQEAPKVQSEAIQFESADGVQLQGTMYKAVMTGADKIVAAKAEGDAPVVILLHPFLGEPSAKEWDGLAVVLASRGFHVLRFDFRGHGKSTVISKNFWDATFYPENTKMFNALSRTKPLPLKLENAELKKKPGYFPMLVNDILAARIAVDKMNDDGKLNAATVYLIGAGDAATLGMMYMTAEWTRPQKPTEAQAQVIRTLPLSGIEPRESAGKDIAAAIWVGPTRHPSISEKNMKDWVKLVPDMRDGNAVLCLYGDEDAAGKKFSNYLVDDVLVAKPGKDSRLNKLTFTVAKGIPKSKQTGVGLLNSTNAPDTEKEILKYLEAVEKDRKNVTKVVNRNYNTAPYMSPGSLGVLVK